MERVLQTFREYPVVAGVGFFLLVSLFLAILLGTWMQRSGTSLKPLVFFFGFVAIIGVPQAAVHLLDAYTHARATRQIETAPSGAASAGENKITPLKPVPWRVVFGPDADPDLISDAKRGLGPVLSQAEEAKLSFSRSGTSALAARFATSGDAADALNRYGTFFQFANATGSDEVGWTARRAGGQGEWTHVVAAGNELYAWSGPTKEAVETKRVKALGAMQAVSAPERQVEPVSRTQASTRLAQNPLAMSLFLGINLLLAVGWFFKASAWAGQTVPAPGTHTEDEAVLRERLLAAGTSESPLVVRALDGGRSLEVTWRYGDAKWFDLLRAHRTMRVHRLVLEPDKRSRKVRVREYWSTFDGSASPKDLRVEWHAMSGMQFFQVEHQRVIGVQLGEDGRPTGSLSAAYHFNLQELKRPIISAVTECGWTWQPIMLDVPGPLRLLTE